MAYVAEARNRTLMMLRNSSPVASSASQAPGRDRCDSVESSCQRVQTVAVRPACTSAVATNNTRRPASWRHQKAKTPVNMGIRIRARIIAGLVLERAQLVHVDVVELAA